MDNSLPELPIELWQTVFSWLPFRDQVNCRQVCIYWRDLITALPEFKRKNCLYLDYCTISENEPPVTILQNSTLPFSSLIIKGGIKVEVYQRLQEFLIEIGQNITYLDLSLLGDMKTFRLIIKNLKSFKVLNHLKIGLVIFLLPIVQEMVNSKPYDYSSQITDNMRISTSVRVISMEIVKETAEDIKKMLTFFPSIQEINIESQHRRLEGNFLKILDTFAEKITSIQVQATDEADDMDQIEKLNLCNLTQLGVWASDHQLLKQIVDRCVELFPTIKSVSAFVYCLPQSHFDYITELQILLGSVHVNLSKLSAFKNLHTLLLFLQREFCFFDHIAVPLPSVKHFSLTSNDPVSCSQCTASILQSLPNVRVLDFKDPDNKCLDIVFKYQPYLEELKINSWFDSSTFVPNQEWPEMKRLRYMYLKYPVIGGDKDSWENFGSKLNRLKYFEVRAGQSVDFVKMIGPTMPGLQKIWKFIDKKFEALTARRDNEGRRIFVADKL